MNLLIVGITVIGYVPTYGNNHADPNWMDIPSMKVIELVAISACLFVADID